ncbi:PP2C family protein-serine/threonine phosphatase [Marininema halotolerans]|uniref:Sigma-B regulation protein RsbU (Phosphoserine phosphatase) n=1 Tax=Marininema halotolerans TaxID=1155944 RepID=A0A1I6Q1S0_9BACL|nr:PP2C family protein-serine/threonine phosphatase [Marininema halotolerans]SFS46268.1 sigma-B regulation protein RsbU (phosphoserine phosphatase) [Marininema halotolerans]
MELILDKQFASAIEHMSEGVCITDPRLPDNPIVYVNPGFTQLTGYTAEEALGKNCRFLQSENTDTTSIDKIRHAIQRQASVTSVLLNRHKNGSLFWNELRVNPVTNEHGELIHYVGVQTDVTTRIEAKRDMSLAAKVQRTMLPTSTENSHFCLETIYQPHSFISGDCYDYYWDEEKKILSGYLFDIMGHGVATALQSSALRVLFEQASKKKLSLADKLAWVNDACLPYLADEYFFAAICFEMDFSQGMLRYAVGGVNYFLAERDRRHEMIGTPGMFLGIFEGMRFKEECIPFAKGDAFYFFSDGLYEKMPYPFTYEQRNFDETVHWLKALSQEPKRKDDVSALCIHVKEGN